MRLMGYAAVLLAAATCILRDLAPLFGKDPAVGFTFLTLSISLALGWLLGPHGPISRGAERATLRRNKADSRPARFLI